MRKKRPIERKVEWVRDTSLIVIASEDRYAVKQYFDLFRSTRIQFRVLETEHGHSAPAHVLDRLDGFMQEYNFGPGDEFWLVCDTDHWIDSGHIQNLRQVIQLCRQKGIDVALSNPCFDLWLLLHFAEFPAKEVSCVSVGDQLRSAVGSYNKTRIFNLPFDDDRVWAAIRRSKERPPEGDIPNAMSTAVHRLLEPLIERFRVSVNQDNGNTNG